MQPILINSHSGRDAWDEGQSRDFFKEALFLEAALDIPIVHETHRGRSLFNPWITQRLLGQFEHLHLCCDLSHWVCVCERLLDDESIIEQCAQHCLHLHARVGYEQGPQVPDPRARNTSDTWKRTSAGGSSSGMPKNPEDCQSAL